MRGVATKARWLALLVPLMLYACSDDPEPTPTPDGGSPVADGGTGGTALSPCVDKPGQLSPPSGQLPCELLPPGFSK